MNLTAKSGPPEAGYKRVQPVFRGSGGEYFGIWIVNVLLTILTVGIYSAWAKVRRKQYFYSNTEIAGSTFEYTGDPIAILKGRIIAYAFVIAMAISSRWDVRIYFALAAVLTLVMPWLLVKSLQFNARNSLWRGISFHFRGGVFDAYITYYALGFATIMSVGLLWPFWVLEQHKFLASNHTFGTTPFKFDASPGKYYKHLLLPIVLGVLAYVALFALILSVSTSDASKDAKDAVAIVAVFAVFLVYIVFLLLGIYLQAVQANLLYSHTQVGDNKLVSTVGFWRLAWIYLSNLVLVVVTLGLATPWAQIRLLKYRLQNFAIDTPGNLDEFVAASEPSRSAIGEEIASAMDFGIDISL